MIAWLVVWNINFIFPYIDPDDPGSNNSYIKGRTWATVQITSQGSFCTKKWSWANPFVFAFIL